MQEVIKAARRYEATISRSTYWQDARDMAAELTRFSDKAEEFLESFGRLSMNSKILLGKESVCDVVKTTGVISKIAILSRDNSQRLPNDRSGPGQKYANNELIVRLCQIFKKAHPNSKRSQGRPEFLQRCIRPLGITLGPDGLKSFVRRALKKGANF